MRYLILIGTLTLAGCGQLNTFVTANQAAVIRDAQTANDNMVHGIEAASCAIPIGAVIRNPEFIPIAEAACIPAGTQSNPVSMFQTMQGTHSVPAYEVPSTTAQAPIQPVIQNAPSAPIPHKAVIKSSKVPPQRQNAQLIAPKAVINAPAAQLVAPTQAVPFGILPSGALP